RMCMSPCRAMPSPWRVGVGDGIAPMWRSWFREWSGAAVSPDGVLDGVGDRVAVGLRARVLVERPGPDAVAAVAVDADVPVVVFLEYQGKAGTLGLRQRRGADSARDACCGFSSSGD